MAEGGDGDTADADVEFERDHAWDIYARIFACMSEIGHIEKDKFVEIKGKVAYEYISHDAVSANVRVPFLKYGIMVLPSVISHENNGNRTELTVKVEFINVDKPDDRIAVEVVGYGVDNADKGPGKALSYAVKYAYLKLLMLNSADDIELDDIKHDPEAKRQSAVDEAQDAARAAYEAAVKDIIKALEGCQSVGEVDLLQRDNKEMLMAVPDVTREYVVKHIQARKQELAAEGAEE